MQMVPDPDPAPVISLESVRVVQRSMGQIDGPVDLVSLGVEDDKIA